MIWHLLGPAHLYADEPVFDLGGLQVLRELRCKTRTPIKSKQRMYRVRTISAESRSDW